MWRIFFDYHTGILAGLAVTLHLCLWIWSIGVSMGIVVGVLGHRVAWIGRLLRMASFLSMSIPAIIVLFWMHYPLQELVGVVIDPFMTSVAALSLINTVAMGQIVKQALDEFPQQYQLAGVVCGMTDREILLKIQFPIILRQVLPMSLNQQVLMLQMTLFASLISVEEIFRVAQHINSLVYKPIEIYSALALFFIIICMPINVAAEWLKRRFTRNLSEK